MHIIIGHFAQKSPQKVTHEHIYSEWGVNVQYDLRKLERLKKN